MPHVVIDGPVDLKGYAEGFTPILLRRNGDVYRADHAYVDASGRNLLVEALVVESGRKLPFYVKVSAHGSGSATVRIDPLTHPARSEGVKELVAWIGSDLLEKNAGAEVRVTNLVLRSAVQQGRTLG